MATRDSACILARLALEQLPAEGGTLPEAIVTHLAGCPHCQGQLKITLPRRALTLILVADQRAAGPARGSDEAEEFILFDHSAGDPPRRLTIIVRERTAESWEMQVSTDPPATGILLLTIGIKTFAAPFGEDGIAHIRRIPMATLTDPEDTDLELAILPLLGERG